MPPDNLAQDSTEAGSWAEVIAELDYISDAAKAYLGDYVGKLIGAGIPPLLSQGHLAFLLGMPDQLFGYYAAKSDLSYRSFEIPKRSGGNRLIHAPSPNLLYIQRWILENILQPIAISNHAYAYVRKRSFVDHVRLHATSDEILSLDLKDFFPSISSRRVIGLFKSFGYAFDVSSVLANLCTFRNRLPQGGATSPTLSNLICRKLDSRLDGLCRQTGLTYSRYADDMLISGPRVRASIALITEKIVQEEGFLVNSNKTKTYMRSPKTFGYITIRDGKLNVSRAAKHKIRGEAHLLTRLAADAYDPHVAFRASLVASRLAGLLAHCKSIDPEDKFVGDTVKDVSTAVKHLISV